MVKRRTDEIRKRQEEASGATIFILKEFGPTYFLLQDERGRKYKLQLGERHECTCGDFKTTGELCVHIYWIMLKKFKVDAENPVCWQPGLVEREIVDLLDGKHSKCNLKEDQRAENSSPEIPILAVDQKEPLKQRPINAGDICPICQDELLSEKRKPVTYCRKGCGNNVHIRCMRVWTDHQRRERTIGLSETVPCPVCRGEFGPLGLLVHENPDNVTRSGMYRSHKISIMSLPSMQPLQPIKRPVHQGTVCLSCRCTPIYGNLYRCQICLEQSVAEANTYICSECFKSNEHSNHDRFVYKEDPQRKWAVVAANRCVPVNLGSKLTNQCVLSAAGKNLIDSATPKAVVDTLRLSDLSLLPHWVVRTPRHQPMGISNLESRTRVVPRQNNSWQQLNETEFGSILTGNQASVDNWGLFKTNGLLAPGRQCRICLMVYQIGQLVRKLHPGCQHIFHAGCIDPWLLHQSSTCPLDGIRVTPVAHPTKVSLLGANREPSDSLTGVPSIQGMRMHTNHFGTNLAKPAAGAVMFDSSRRRNAGTDSKPSLDSAADFSVVGQHVVASQTHAHQGMGSENSRKPVQNTSVIKNSRFYSGTY